MRFLLPVICILLFNLTAIAQTNYRIQAEFTIKEKKTDGTTHLIMGRVFYDKFIKKLVYDISFPEKETLVITDSTLYKIVNNKIAERKYYPSLNDFTIFHLSLNEDLSYFGLNNSPYQLAEVTKDKGMVISTWKAPKTLSEQLGDAVISQKEKRLYGMVFYSPSGQIITKHFFKNYNNFRGLEFPQEMIQITYSGDKELYKVTSFKNVLINEIKNENFYNYRIPD
jgi:hypothetical protein